MSSIHTSQHPSHGRLSPAGAHHSELSRGGRPSTSWLGRSYWRRACAVIALGLLTSAGALAEPTAADKETARALLGAGQKKFDAGDFAGALEAWRAADQLMQVPTTGLRVGKAQEKLGRLVEARDTWLRVARSPEQPAEPRVFAAARKESAQLAAEIERRIPSMSVKVSGVAAGTQLVVAVDGVSVPPAAALLPRRLNPGAHQLTVSAEGYTEAAARVMLIEGDNRVIELALSPAAPPPPPTAIELEPPPPAPPAPPPPEGHTAPSPGHAADTGGGASTLTIVGFSLAGVGVAVGAITGAMSASRTSDIKQRCDGTRCPADSQADIDSASDLALVSNVGFGVGVLGLGLGLYGLLTNGEPGGSQPSARQPAAPVQLAGRKVLLTPVVGLGSFNLIGKF